VEAARAALEAERDKEEARRRAALAQNSSEEVAIVGFQGGNDWIVAQRERQREKLAQRLAIHKSDEPLVAFDREQFSREVKRVLDDDKSAGFVIVLKRRREFATRLCHDYKFFTEKQKLELVLALAVDLGIQDLSQMVKSLPSLPRTHLVLNVMAAALGFDRKNDPTIAKNIKKGLVPLPEQFFLLVGTVPLGPKFLLRLRLDLSLLLRKYGAGLPSDNLQALEYLDLVMRDLFATQAGTRFRRIDMASEKLVAFVLKNERVHAIRNWMDLRRRISGPNRYCFGLFHLQMPFSPLVFVQVIVSDHLCDKIDPILNDDGPTSLVSPSHIVFYSISNANAGLRELNTASHLLFLTIERMAHLYPQCHTAATLSPVPGFAGWFKAELERAHARHVYFSDTHSQHLAVKFGVHQGQLAKWLLKKLSTPDWHRDQEFTTAIRDVLVKACALYVLFERNGDKMLNPVANFHLQNGAQVEQVNFLADPSTAGADDALTFMINYRYVMTSIAHTSDSYKRTSAAAVSLRVMRLVWPSSSVILDGAFFRSYYTVLMWWSR
jgi:malonyl-CoA decarboxylase